MNIKKITFFLLLISFNSLFAQEKNKGDFIIEINVGPSFANFVNSEAPHKIHIYGSDETPAILPTTDVTKSLSYTDYNTSLISDILLGISTGINLEYLISNNLSVNSGLNFEMKGINLKYSEERVGSLATSEPPIYSVYGEITENLNIKIKNNYLIVPISIRKYLLEKKNLFIESGIYTGYLISSKIDIQGEKIVDVDYSDNNFEYRWWIDNEKDKEKEFTKEFDFGILVAAGYNKYLSDKLLFNTKIGINVGMVKLDSKYNNEYELSPISFSSSLLRSTNYYGLNSNSKNINFVFTVGLGYLIGK
ncbi:MAG TPA: hypothetical protein DCG75_01755 [Bacteroidales bacterium]|nr:hypothetical protein [Bacteroidales bacterium]